MVHGNTHAVVLRHLLRAGQAVLQLHTLDGRCVASQPPCACQDDPDNCRHGCAVGYAPAQPGTCAHQLPIPRAAGAFNPGLAVLCAAGELPACLGG